MFSLDGSCSGPSVLSWVPILATTLEIQFARLGGSGVSHFQCWLQAVVGDKTPTAAVGSRMPGMCGMFFCWWFSQDFGIVIIHISQSGESSSSPDTYTNTHAEQSLCRDLPSCRPSLRPSESWREALLHILCTGEQKIWCRPFVFFAIGKYKAGRVN